VQTQYFQPSSRPSCGSPALTRENHLPVSARTPALLRLESPSNPTAALASPQQLEGQATAATANIESSFGLIIQYYLL